MILSPFGRSFSSRGGTFLLARSIRANLVNDESKRNLDRSKLPSTLSVEPITIRFIRAVWSCLKFYLRVCLPLNFPPSSFSLFRCADFGSVSFEFSSSSFYLSRTSWRNIPAQDNRIYFGMDNIFPIIFVRNFRNTDASCASLTIFFLLFVHFRYIIITFFRFSWFYWFIDNPFDMFVYL